MIGFVTAYDYTRIEEILDNEIHQLMYFAKFSYRDALGLTFVERHRFLKLTEDTIQSRSGNNDMQLLSENITQGMLGGNFP